MLVADADADARRAVACALARVAPAVEVHEAATVEDAAACTRTVALDCVFLDHALPSADGRPPLARIRESGRGDVPVVVLTGRGDEQAAVSLMQAGAADYVAKAALTPERLGQSLRYAAELARAAAATREAQEELREAAERTRFLAEASRVLADSLDVETTLRATARIAVPRLADVCVAALVDPRTARGVVVETRDPALAALAGELERHLRFAPDHPASALGESVRTGRTRRMASIPDAHLAAVADDEAGLRVLRALAPRAALVVPLVARGTVLGAVGFARVTPTPHDAAEQALAEDLVQRSALALDNARLFALATEARRHAEDAAARTERLQALTAALAGAASEREVGELVMRHGVLPTGAYAGVIAEPTADGQEIELLTCVGYPPEACMHVGRRWPAAARIPLADAVRTGEAVFVASPQAWAERYAGGYAPATVAPAPRPAAGPPSASRAWAALPLHLGAGRGAILWTFDTPRDFSDADRALLSAIAQQCAQAIERARLRDAERRARAEAEEANRAKSEFLARMSHDLRTPLNAIGGYTQLIEMGLHGPVTEAQVGALARIRRAQEHLLTLINDILSFARLEAGQVRVTLAPVPVASVIEELAALVRPEAATRGLALEADAGPAGLVVRADRGRLMQVLLNLTSNALKFTDDGTVRVAAAASGEGVEFRVSDTGRGVPPDRLEAIFAPFHQVRGVVDEQKGGVGLGLAISRELARLMDGELTVESEEGRGSTFRVRLARA